MKKSLLWLVFSAVMVLLFASTAMAQHYAENGESMAAPTATVTATEAARNSLQPCSRQRKPAEKLALATSYTPVTLALVRQPCIYYLKQTGGPSLVAPLALGALMVVVGSSVVMRAILRKYTL